MSTYNDGQIDASLREQRLVQQRANLRAELRAEFMKKSTNPYSHMVGEGKYGGYLFDPAMQRWISMRASQYDFFKPTAKTIHMPLLVVGSVGLLTWIVSYRRNKKEKAFRAGEVAYRDREFKYV